MSSAEEVRAGVLSENPVAVLLLGLCPAAAVSTRVVDALWMSIGVAAVLLATALCTALISHAGAPGGEGRRDSPASRLLGALVITSVLTAAFETVLLALAPEASASLGIYAPLIAVNCLVLGRGRAPRRPGIAPSLARAAGNGTGFSACLILIAVVRESLGAGTITLFPVGGFGGTIALGSLAADPARGLGMAGGALLCLGYLAGAARALRSRRAARTESRAGSS
jgi:electron transport complex protein RnfE